MQQNEENAVAELAADNTAVYTSGIPLYILLPLCALASTLICTGGWRSGLRSTLLGAALLTGVFLLKKFNILEINWKLRIPYFLLSGILSGLLGASVISALEMLIGSPTLGNNPYNQDTLNLFLVCPLYGFFMLGAYASAISLSRIKRYFIVLAGAALANTVGIADLTLEPTLKYLFETIFFYYLACMGNCAWFVFLWYRCADGICYKLIKKIRPRDWFLLIIAGVVLGYFGYMMVGLGSVQIANRRYLRKYKNTVFKEKMTGIIVVPMYKEYYDCEKRSFCDLPEKMEFDRDFDYCNSKLQVERTKDGKTLHIKTSDGKNVTFNLGQERYCNNFYLFEDTVYYRAERKLFRLKGPGYKQPELVLNEFDSYRFCVSPDHKFIVYYGGANHIFSCVLCIADLKSKKILSVSTASAFMPKLFWVRDLKELKQLAEEYGKQKKLREEKERQERKKRWEEEKMKKLKKQTKK